MKYSFERAIKIQDANGAAIYLLGSITDTAKDGTVTLNKGAIETPDDQTVVFHLDHPDTTFQYVLTYPGAAAIVDEDVFPADKKLADDQVIGSGPYKLSQYKAGEQAVLELNANYTGPNTGKTRSGLRQVLLRPVCARSSRSKNGEVDVAWRSLGPTDIATLKKDSNVTVATGKGSEIRYWVWKRRRPGRQAAGDPPGGRPAHRPGRHRQERLRRHRRPAVLHRAPGLRRPEGLLQGRSTARPDPAKAKQILQAAGISTPVNLTVGWTPDPLRSEHRGRGERAAASARVQRAVQGRR